MNQNVAVNVTDLSAHDGQRPLLGNFCALGHIHVSKFVSDDFFDNFCKESVPVLKGTPFTPVILTHIRKLLKPLGDVTTRSMS